MEVQTPLQAMRLGGFLRGRWPWRSAAYLLTTAPVIAVVSPLFAVLGLPWLYVLAHRDRDEPSLGTAAFLVILGAVLIGGLGPLLAVPLGAVERLRLRIVDDRAVTSGHRPAGPVAWLRVRYTEEATWRSLAYALLLATVGAAAYACWG